jgi:hypothetical protein
VLIDVLRRNGRVQLLGAAHRRYVGRRVRIRSFADGRVVARPRVRRDGTFRATAVLPPRKLRHTNRARYQARIGKERSLRLKLARRMIVTRTGRRAGRVVIAGRVVRPLTRPLARVVVKRRVSCGRWKVVRRFTPRAGGRFRVALPRPREGHAAVYRMRTRVRYRTGVAKRFPTFTLPRYVDLG